MRCPQAKHIKHRPSRAGPAPPHRPPLICPTSHHSKITQAPLHQPAQCAHAKDTRQLSSNPPRSGPLCCVAYPPGSARPTEAARPPLTARQPYVALQSCAAFPPTCRRQQPRPHRSRRVPAIAPSITPPPQSLQTHLIATAARPHPLTLQKLNRTSSIPSRSTPRLAA